MGFTALHLLAAMAGSSLPKAETISVKELKGKVVALLKKGKFEPNLQDSNGNSGKLL